jgi:MarR family transcriptional regulator, protease production regulatory protein HPr
MDLEKKKQLSIIIRRLHLHIIGKTSVISKRFNLTSPQQFILFILFTANSPLLMKEIGSLSGWERSTVTRLLKPLREKIL